MATELEVTAAPSAVPSLGVTVHVITSPLLKDAPVSVLAVCPAMVVPFFDQAKLKLTVSPSASAPTGVQVSVVVSYAVVDVSVTDVSVGALLEIVRVLEATALPSLVPSLGVTVHWTE